MRGRRLHSVIERVKLGLSEGEEVENDEVGETIDDGDPIRVTEFEPISEQSRSEVSGGDQE